ncbi:phospholipase A [Desulfuromonas sp. DDH964]|uniref:phospholipase A n=1 Tax=Desulfuromonas sp. DDH964 TaxID=1823759 RepID=UPI0018D3923A|nr:phospholipase A [Desulfuromonas sp. DDH964]
MKLEGKLESNPFSITTYKRNYLLPLSYNASPNRRTTSDVGDTVDHAEVEFQVSLQFPLVNSLWKENGRLFLAYTNHSWWQAYNSDASSPFRETNHEPELMLAIRTDQRIFGFDAKSFTFGLVHQSNGRSGTLSRSWNRVQGYFIFERGRLVLALCPWYRIPEEAKTGPDDSSGDDNPDLERYLGYGELTAVYKLGEQTLGMVWRNNLRAEGNKGAIEIDWSFPLAGRFKGYVKYFNGYGESLVDYNASSNRIGVGLLFSDLL